MFKEIKNEIEMKKFGQLIGELLCGGEFIELIGDVGSGKTTLTKGIAVGLGVEDQVQSPSFTINRVYEGRDHLMLSHYDFYRLNDAGIMTDELKESVDDTSSIIVIEWAGAVSKILPIDRLTIRFESPTDTNRVLNLSAVGLKSQQIVDRLFL